MGKPNSPTPPDPQSLIQQSTAANKDIAGYTFGLNAVNQFTPFGSQTYSRTAGTNGQPDRWSSTTKFSPGVQAIMDAMQGGQRSIASAGAKAAGGLSGSLKNITAPSYQRFGGAPSLATSFNGGGPIQRSIGGADDYSADRQRVEDTLFGELDTRSGRDQATLETQLANKGIAVGSDAYTRAMSDFQKGRSSDRTNAILSAGQEQNRLQGLELNAGQFANAAQGQQFGQNATMAGFGNDARQQGFQNQNQLVGLNNQVNQQRFQDQITGNNQNINQALSLLNGTQVQQPQFGQTPQVGVGGTDVAGIAQNGYQNQVNQYNQQQQNLGGIFGTLGTLGSAFAPWLMSDARTKSEIEYDGGETRDGIPTATYRYKWEEPGTRHHGVIAQDVEKVRPDAIRKIGGIRLVDTRKIREAA